MKSKTALTIALLICVLLASNLRFIGENVTEAQLSQATFGNEVIGNSGIYFLNYKVASKFQLSEQGTIESISVYFIRSDFNAKAAIYADSNGKPQAMLSQSNSEYVSFGGWHEFALPQTQLSSGNYWLSVVSESVNAVGRKVDTETPQTCMTTNYYPSEFTNPFGTNLWYDSCSVSIYATYVSDVQPTPLAQLSFGLYSDQACTSKQSSISWGRLSLGTTNTQVLYVRNEGNIPITLDKTMSNWNPSNLAEYLTLNWDYVNQSCRAGDTLKLTLTLTVSDRITGITNFSFDTSITATG
jgi:hypothetical protein